MIEEKPWLDGLSRIWRVPYDKELAFATVGFWLIHAPWMHLAWSWHVASVVHLRPIAGEPAKLQFKGATHEFTVAALDPKHDPTLDHESFKWLKPISIVQQFISKSDSEAKETIENFMVAVAGGRLSVDSDYRSSWKRLLLPGTAKPGGN